MTDLQRQPLRGAALYNPHLHGRDELISLFVVREDLLRDLLEDLRATSSGKTPQHHLILGQRGMGKTMLLRRLGFAIEEDAVLGSGWVPLSFPEEQYNIAHLSDFWLNCTDALSDWLEIQGLDAEAEELDEKAEALRPLAEDRRTREALALLVSTAKAIRRRLVLLVDNVDLVFERVKEQEWALREALSSESALLLIGASANAVESSFSYGQAFYDFFRLHELEGLSLEEMRTLLIHYSEVWGYPAVKKIAEQEPARIQVLHTLTGGNPRTAILLFSVLTSSVEGDVRTDLERLLDQCTPLYKARFEELAPQQQQVVHALAVHWDPISAGELADLLIMEVNAVSSHLARLVKQGLVEKVDYDPESKTGFQIGERFFNIWYLMRASRRVRRRLVWLVEFLKMFYSQEQLRGRALLHIQSGLSLDPGLRLRYAEYSFALADAIQDRAWSSSLERAGLHAILRDECLRSQLSDLVDLEHSEPDLKKRADLQQRLDQARSKVLSVQVDLPGWSGENFWTRLKDSLLIDTEVKIWIAERLTDMKLQQLAGLKSEFEREHDIIARQYACGPTVEALTMAIRTGLMTGPTDIEGAIQAEMVLGAPGLKAVALANLIELKDDRALLSTLEDALDTTTSPFPLLTWFRRSVDLGKRPAKTKIAKLIRRVADIGSDSPEVIRSLIRNLIRVVQPIELEAIYKPILYRNQQKAVLWLGFGDILVQSRERADEAEAAYRQCLELDPRIADAWVQLGFLHMLAGRFNEAEQAQRKAIEIGGSWAAWGGLAGTALSMGKFDVSEDCFRRAIELNSEIAYVWSGLGLALAALQRRAEAEIAFRRAVEIDRESPEFGLMLALFLWEGGDFDAAEQLSRGASARHKVFSGVLAAALAHKGDWDGAVEAARTFLAGEANSELREGWYWTLAFFRGAVQAGKARESVSILEELGADERWRPLREALEAVARRSEGYLRRVAPEVRKPARAIYKQLIEQGSSPVHPSTVPRSSRLGKDSRRGKTRGRLAARPR